MTIEEIDNLRIGLQESFDSLVESIKKVQIGNRDQFPFGWRNSAKGRTVWRILEEIITQNLEKDHKKFKLKSIIPSTSEVSVYDFECKLEAIDTPIYINIKSAMLNGRKNKDDISKGQGLKEFYQDDVNKTFFIGTFFIKFNEDMSIEINNATVFPIAWIKDIYVNPSNNGNLQSAYYKDIRDAVRRTNADFHELFLKSLSFAQKKKSSKNGDIIENIDGGFLKKVNGRWKNSDYAGNLI